MAKSKSNGSRTGSGKQATQAAHDNRANQLNPNNDKYYQSRGQKGRPDKSGGGSPRGARKD